MGYKNIDLYGYHCHVGSQVFDAETFIDAVDIMMDFSAEVKRRYGYEGEILNLGGGFGVRYVASQPDLDIENSIREVGEVLTQKCADLNMKKPKILMEPGRSIVADSGMTLYTVGTVKQITNFKNYVAIDGGMADNPRFALYDAEYTVITANKATLPKHYRIIAKPPVVMIYGGKDYVAVRRETYEDIIRNDV